ncbi:MAG: redoxin domain-containing protein [Bacteroidales bacterium]
MKNITLLLAISLLMPLSMAGQQETDPIVEQLAIGADMPWFSLPGTDDKIYTPEDFRDYDMLVMIFTCNHCPTAQAYEQRILNLYRDFSSKGVGFVAISPNSNEALSLAECGYSDLDDSFEAMKIRAKDLGLEFPYLFDGETSETSVRFGPVATPHVFIFDKERKLRYRGRIDDMESPYEKPGTKDTRNAINALLNGEPVLVETTKTFGCSVKWPWKDAWTKQLIEDWDNEKVVLDYGERENLEELLVNNSENLLLVNVWATYCGPCIIEFPDLVETYRMYNGRGLDFVSISMDRPGNEENVLQFLTDKNAAVTNYLWTGGTSYDAVDIIDHGWQGSLPFTLLIKPGGTVLFSHEGAVDILTLRKAIIGELGRYFADD